MLSGAFKCETHGKLKECAAHRGFPSFLRCHWVRKLLGIYLQKDGMGWDGMGWVRHCTVNTVR